MSNQTNTAAHTDEEKIKYMANRFLGWKLPDDFKPDAGIKFDPVFNKGTPQEMRHEPSGTNLFHIGQAEAMVRYMIEGLPSTNLVNAAPDLLDSLRGVWPYLLEYDRLLRSQKTVSPDFIKALEAASAVLQKIKGAA